MTRSPDRCLERSLPQAATAGFARFPADPLAAATDAGAARGTKGV